jgi:hypothetical protein
MNITNSKLVSPSSKAYSFRAIRTFVARCLIAVGKLCAAVGIDFAERAHKIAPWVKNEPEPAPPPKRRAF